MVAPLTAPDVSPEQWRLAAPLVSSVPGRRDPELLRQVVEQFGVESNPRYQPGLGYTQCHIFLWDVTSALGAEIPHWVDPTGERVPPGQGAELSANAVVDWLEKHGLAHGWSETDEAGARAAARAGRPAVAVWANPAPGGAGHLALVLPDDGDLRASPLLAQAGGTCFSGKPLWMGFGVYKPRYFQHA